MTDLNKKEKIFAVVAYVLYSVVLICQRNLAFCAIYFIAIAIALFFADKIFGSETVIQKKTLCAFFIIGIGFQTTFEIFFSTHGEIQKLLAACAAALFFCCIFAMTDKGKLKFCIAAAPVLCLLNVKIAAAYCVTLFCLETVHLLTKPSAKNARKSKKKKTKEKKSLAIPAIVVSVICFGVCLFLMITDDKYALENSDYLLIRFKNPPAMIIAAIYLSIKLFKGNFSAKKGLGAVLAVFVAAAAVSTVFLGWSVFALFTLCIPVFLGLLCIENGDTVQSIRTDYNNHKFIFWVLIVCALQ